MCNSRRGKVRTRWSILAHQATYRRWLKKIAPSIQRIRRDIDPYVYNERLQAASQQKTQQIEIPQGYHYGTDYNTLHMMPNLVYQGTRDFNPQMGQQVPRNPNPQADEFCSRWPRWWIISLVWSQKGWPFRINAHIWSGMIWSLFLQITGSQSTPSSLVKTVQAQ